MIPISLSSAYASSVFALNQRVRYEERLSESPFVERIWRTESDEDDVCIAIADGRWDLMFYTLNGKTNVMVTGAQNGVVTIPHLAGSQWLGIRFRLGVMMENIAINALVNEGIDLPQGTARSFWLNSSTWTLPTFENADVFLSRLAHTDFFAIDPVIAALLNGEVPPYSPRALQYRFQDRIGLSAKTIQQIERAQHAVVQLEQHIPIADVAFALGYYDQSHLTNALRRYIGRTPAQIAAQIRPK